MESKRKQNYYRKKFLYFSYWMVGVTSTATWETLADHHSWQPQLSVPPESVCCKGLSEDRNDPPSHCHTWQASWSLVPSATLQSVNNLCGTVRSRETAIVEAISTPSVWYARLWDIGIHTTWDKSAPTFNTYGQKTYSSDQLLKTSVMADVFRQSVGARTAGAAGKGAALISPFLCAQHSYSNLSTTRSPELHLTGQGVSLLDFFFAFLFKERCALFGGFVDCF